MKAAEDCPSPKASPVRGASESRASVLDCGSPLLLFLTAPKTRDEDEDECEMSSPQIHLSAAAKASLPTHVAIIMDGNGRWAKQRSLPRVEGHRNGAESVRAVVRAAGEIGIKYLTLYAFSVENWSRPKEEVDTLMKYLARYLRNEIGELQKNQVRLEVIGQIYRLPEFVQEQLRKTTTALANNKGLTLVLALSYGGRTEILDPGRSLAGQVKKGKLDAAENYEKNLRENLYTKKLPEPDL